MIMDATTRFARTEDGVNIAYAVFGEGPQIVFASTIWGTLHMLRSGVLGRRAEIDALVARGFSVAVYDCRGTGASDRNVTDFSLDARVRDLEAVIDHLARNQYIIAGTFLATPIALEYAARHPARVSRLVLGNPVASRAEHNTSVPAWTMIEALHDTADQDWDFFTQSLASAVTSFGDRDAIRAVAAMMRDGMTPDAFAAFQAAAARIDLTSRLPEVAVPTLVVRADDLSFSASVRLATAMAAAIPNARLVATTDFADAVAAFAGAPPQVAAPASYPPPGVRTVLVTDLVEHTEMMQRLGDQRGRAVLREHEHITRNVLKQHGDAEVKTMGDGFMASFASVTRAMECAIALQRAFAAREGEPLQIRVGLNAGEPIEEDGDLFGATVILASRIAAVAAAGEIVVPETVRGLLSGKAFTFGDRGEFLPKGFDEGVRLWDVRWRD